MRKIAFIIPPHVELLDLAGPVLLLSGDASEGPVVGGVRARPLPPGRGLLVRRVGTPMLIQVADPGPVHAVPRPLPRLQDA